MSCPSSVLAGGAETVQRCLRAGLIEEMRIDLVPILLGDGARRFENLGAAELAIECTRVIAAPGVTHLTYRLGQGAR